MLHALHILLDDSFQLAFHLLLYIHFPLQVLFHQFVVEAIDTCGGCAVKLQDVAIAHILIDAVEIVHGPSVFFRGADQVDTKSELGFGVIEHAQKRGENVYLLGNLIEHLTFGTTGIEDDDR